MPVRSAVGEGRDNLLIALFDTFGESGPSPDLSMRQIADKLDVHHTLLTYHFGSRPGLLAAVLAEGRSRDNKVIAATDADESFASLASAVWKHYAHPDRTARVRAFFHVAGLAMYDTNAFSDFLAELDDLAQMFIRAARRDGKSQAEARRLSINTVACLRGLLLQRLLTDNTRDIDDAARHFLRSLEAEFTS